MKTQRNWTGVNAGMMILVFMLFAACTKKVAFLTSAVVPAAEGNVTIRQDNNKNYDVVLTVRRLADPTRLSPPKSVYVVWMETDQNGAQNMGQLKTDTKGFSNMLTSSLKTVTPHKPTGFFITAEDDASGNYPGMTVVLKTGTMEDR